MNGRHPARALLEKLRPAAPGHMPDRPRGDALSGGYRRASTACWGCWSTTCWHRPPAAAGARGRCQPVRAGRADGPQVPDREQPALEPLRRRHGASGSGKNHAARPSPRCSSPPGSATPRRQQDRLRRRAADRGAPAAGDPVPDRRVRHVPRRQSTAPRPQHIAEILDIMTEIYTMAGTVFFGAEYADQNERRRTSISRASASTGRRCRSTSGTRCSRRTVGRLARPLHRLRSPTTIPTGSRSRGPPHLAAGAHRRASS